jgi:two-component system sensor histidine kinase DevS
MGGEEPHMVSLTREQLEDRLAALHRASLELVRDLSRNAVLERIIHLAREQADAHYAALGLVDESGELVKFIPVGMTEREITRMAHPPKGLGLIGTLQEEKQTIRVPRIQDDSRSIGFPKNHPNMESFLGVPIISGDRLLGQIYLTDKKNGAEFTEEDESVIETLAAYAAVAIENARLYETVVKRDKKLTQRNQDLSLLNDLAKTLAGSMEVDEILDETLSRIINYLGVEAGEVFLREDGRRELQLAIHRGEAPEAFLARERLEVGECFIGRVALLGQTLVSTTLETDIRFKRDAIVKAGFNSIACIPLKARRKVVGVLSVVSRGVHKFSKRELNLLEAIGTWAGTVIENARLQNQTRRLAVLEERERIGMDLHDGIIQSIYGVGLALEYAYLSVEENPVLTREKIDNSIEGLNAAIRDIRAYVADLRPRQLRDEQPLQQGIERLVNDFRTVSNAKATLMTVDDGLAELPRDNSLALFHICQEALANVAKHAHAQNADIHLWTTEDRILLKVEDDGRGFDNKTIDEALGHGLSNMRRRVQKVGGEVEIVSQPMKGTTITAWVPWEEMPPMEDDTNGTRKFNPFE